MRKWLPVVFVGICLAWFLGTQVSTASAAPSSPGDVIAAVNALRASQGLSPLQPNGALMSAAQGHSDYMASIQTTTHDGADGSRPKDRAAAAGYGGGFVTENIYAGRNATAQNVVNWWTSDAPHWNTMMGANYRDIGAGVAEADSVVYYTIDVGSPTGYSAAALLPTPAGGTPATPAPTLAPILPLVTSTPNADGSVVHEVQWGQTLSTIATAYNLSVAQLKALNNLTSDSIVVGQKLIIKAVATATATPAVTAVTPSPTLRPTATRRPPTKTPTTAPTWTPTITLTPTTASVLNNINVRLDRQSMGIGLIVVCALGLLLVGYTSFRRSR